MRLKEIYQGLANGLIFKHDEYGKVYIAGDDRQRNPDTGKITDWSFDKPNEWRIYTKPDWREELNGKITLGYVKDHDINGWSKLVTIITGYKKDCEYPFETQDSGYRHFKPLTKEQNEEFKRNINEVEL